MKNSESKKRYVLPGDFITTAPLRLHGNVVLEGKRIISTAIGLSDISTDSARVISLTGVYIPKIDDLVIGTITSVSGNSWVCRYQFMLSRNAFGSGRIWKRFISYYERNER